MGTLVEVGTLVEGTAAEGTVAVEGDMLPVHKVVADLYRGLP